LVEHFGTTPHGTYFSVDHRLSEAGCEACHGPAAAHIEEGDPELIINPATDDQFDAGKLCLDCHAGREFDDWAFSEHFTSDIGCTSCHSIHRQGYKSSTTKGPEVCYTCHSDVRAAAYMPSRHPIAEGKIDCIDCHSPHGAQVAFTQERSGRELCFSCHANVEGPFIFEHAPVEEDCMICHTPHGSVADNLLKQNEPALCLDCHAMHFHATIDGLEGNFIPPADSSLLVESTADGWKTGMLTKCSQCHTMVHGSDLPSQAISGGASGLTR
jgi:DmsE family decaheme c-type cytochrome